MGEWESPDIERQYKNAKAKRWSDANPERARASNLEATRRYRDKYPERQREIARRWRAKHPDYISWSARNPERHKELSRASHLAAHYNLTPEEYEALYISQNGLCAICLRPPAEGKVLVVDHDHDKSRIRALLCNPCNTGLGRFKDNPDILRAAITYLEKWNDSSP